ncbi:uncharacterized protein LOC133842670 [Drosophila sulfurigaster albostrigata]|uniref:uncharacterized protein LOC133842670 n=1 Tax=Drosophila sulfurigaster albostrigata TaxID=89887 RepID=UPI002D219590|nr:uncharacterized protein LOC133842670 [Drosophila sulfurigaster albostrigata]
MVKPMERAGCLELRTAGYIIGWLGVAGSVLCLLLGLVGLGNPRIFTGAVESSKYSEDYEAVAAIYSIIFIVSAFVGFAIYGLVIYGIKENRHAMLIPYLILSGISVALSFLGVMMSALNLVSGTHDVIGFVFSVFSCMFQLFIFRVMYSLYTTIKMNILNGRVLVPPSAAAVPLQQTVPTAYPPNAAYPSNTAYPSNAAYPPNAYPTTYPTYNKV